jgi:hypothetical protein
MNIEYINHNAKNIKIKLSSYIKLWISIEKKLKVKILNKVEIP